jgi:hypothetical protein
LIYDRALSSAEVSILYNQYKTRLIIWIMN